MTGGRILLDEHVGRVFERLLRERGHDVEQAKDRLGEYTSDVELIEWCAEHDAVLLTNNARDFEPLHREYDHAGLFLYTIKSCRTPTRRDSLEPSTRFSTSTEPTESKTNSLISGSGTGGSADSGCPRGGVV